MPVRDFFPDRPPAGRFSPSRGQKHPLGHVGKKHPAGPKTRSDSQKVDMVTIGRHPRHDCPLSAPPSAPAPRAATTAVRYVAGPDGGRALGPHRIDGEELFEFTARRPPVRLEENPPDRMAAPGALRLRRTSRDARRRRASALPRSLAGALALKLRPRHPRRLRFLPARIRRDHLGGEDFRARRAKRGTLGMEPPDARDRDLAPGKRRTERRPARSLPRRDRW